MFLSDWAAKPSEYNGHYRSGEEPTKQIQTNIGEKGGFDQGGFQKRSTSAVRDNGRIHPEIGDAADGRIPVCEF